MAKPPRRKPTPRKLRRLPQTNVISLESILREQRRRELETPTPELLAAQRAAIARLTKPERVVFDSAMQRIHRLTSQTSVIEIATLLSDSMHWALPAMVKVYLMHELSKKVKDVQW